MEKSRRDMRKEARSEKKANLHQLRLQRQAYKKNFNKSKSNTAEEAREESDMVEDVDLGSVSPRESHSVAVNVVRKKKGLKRKERTKTNFEKFLEMDDRSVALAAEEDLALERRLAKKLNLKSGKLRGEDDGLGLLFGELPSITEEEVPTQKSEKKITRKKRKVAKPEVDLSEATEMDDSEEITAKKKNTQPDKEEEGDELAGKNIESSAEPKKYIAPHLRAPKNELEEYSQIRRRVRGLLNRLSESNIESITAEMSDIFRSIPRIFASQMIIEEVLASCSNGPRGNEQYAAIFAAFVAGMACSVGVDFSAKLLASLASNFEDEYRKKDNLSLRNITLLLSYLCIFGVCASDLIYDFITMLGQRLTEVDVSTILTILQCCGMKIRAEDPLSMKNFIMSVQSRVHELKTEGPENINGTRMKIMLDLILDIKNNKKRPKEDSANHTRIKKWLQKLRVDEIIIRCVNWSKLLDPDKKGQWWSTVEESTQRYDAEEVANTIDKEVWEAQKMLELAASQGMNTDTRKAIFCIIMSSEDYLDAFEKLLRLDLPGKQDREIMRVLLKCCLQEKIFNRYYPILAIKLCNYEKNHKFTLQFFLWDQYKEVKSMPLVTSFNLAKFVAEMVTSFTLSISVLKPVDLTDVTQLTPKKIMHFRMLFDALLEHPDSVVWNVFTRVAVTPELENLRQGIEFFVKEYVVKKDKKMGDKFRVLKKALNNSEGIFR